jgi:N-acetylglutamate synthase-like GNAT family acetyltransferase
MIRQALDNDFDEIYTIINDAAKAYKNVIPGDRWHDPYMSRAELREQINDGVSFSCYCEEDEMFGVMGIQDKKDVYLIRHAYVRTIKRNTGIGSQLLEKLISNTDKTILIGTWEAASWAISFYVKHGFVLVSKEEKETLLRKYWRIPERQIETSVVLAENRYEQVKKRLLSADKEAD